MDIKHLQFSFRMYWANMKGLLNMVAEGIILVASLASLFILVYQFGFKYSAHVTHMLETSRVYLLLAFFTGISLRYILKFKEIIQEKMLYLDIGIYFFLFAVLSGKVFFKEAIHQSLPYLGFLTEPLFVYFLLLLLSAIHLSRQTFTLLQSHIKPSLLFLLSFVFVILVGSGLLMLPNATVHGIHFVDALFISTTSVCVTGLTTVDVATTFTHTGHIIIMLLIQIGGIGVMTFTSFFALSFMGHSSFTSKLVLKDMLNEDRVNGLFRVILNILFVTLFIEGVGAYLIYLDIKGGLPGGTQEEVFYAVFHAVSAFCNAGISTLSGNMYDPLVAQKYNLHVWIALLIVGILAMIVLIVHVNEAERRIPVQYAKRQVGRKMYGGQASTLPMKVNMSGVLPIIFAQTIASLPATIWAFVGIPEEGTVGRSIYNAIDTKSVLYLIVYFLMIIGFSYFYATIQFNPVEISNNLKRNGGFIPGFRPGKPTSDFIAKVLNKVTLFGAIYLGIVAICPLIAGKLLGNSGLAIGGTSVIIVVGVALETVRALESQMMMRQYKGFLE